MMSIRSGVIRVSVVLGAEALFIWIFIWFFGFKDLAKVVADHRDNPVWMGEFYQYFCMPLLNGCLVIAFLGILSVDRISERTKSVISFLLLLVAFGSIIWTMWPDIVVKTARAVEIVSDPYFWLQAGIVLLGWIVMLSLLTFLAAGGA